MVKEEDLRKDLEGMMEFKLIPVEKKPKCPDCGLPLSKRSISGKYHCNKSGCPVVYVILKKGQPWGRIARITRAASAR